MARSVRAKAKGRAPRAQTFILYRTGGKGADVAEAVVRIEAAPGLKLVDQRRSGLLVEGASTAVKAFAKNLNGWRAEPNRAVEPVAQSG